MSFTWRNLVHGNGSYAIFSRPPSANGAESATACVTGERRCRRRHRSPQVRRRCGDLALVVLDDRHHPRLPGRTSICESSRRMKLECQGQAGLARADAQTEIRQIDGKEDAEGAHLTECGAFCGS